MKDQHKEIVQKYSVLSGTTVCWNYSSKIYRVCRYNLCTFSDWNVGPFFFAKQFKFSRIRWRVFGYNSFQFLLQVLDRIRSGVGLGRSNTCEVLLGPSSLSLLKRGMMLPPPHWGRCDVLYQFSRLLHFGQKVKFWFHLTKGLSSILAVFPTRLLAVCKLDFLWSSFNNGFLLATLP